MPAPDRRFDRRDVLRGGVFVFATALLGGCASLFLKKREPDVTVTAAGGEARVPLRDAPWAADGRNGVLVLGIAGREDKVLVFRDANGALAAVSMTCTHRGCDVEWAPAAARVVCPCHGSEFSSAGAVLEGPATRPLAAFPVRIEGDALVVQVG